MPSIQPIEIIRAESPEGFDGIEQKAPNRYDILKTEGKFSTHFYHTQKPKNVDKTGTRANIKKLTL